jgi:putative hydrolase of the HAD superfamily
MKVMVFDLDDTLYDEMSYVRSGFHAVAVELARQYKQDSCKLFQVMWNHLQRHGRGTVFDAALEAIGRRNKINVRQCVSVYRQHQPQLTLYDDAEHILSYLEKKSIPIYIVTDGNKIVQYNKIRSLNLESRMRKCFITHRHSIKYSKPSPYCFHKIVQIEKVEPQDIVYVGDNIAKDFVGIKPLGFETVRVMRGSYISLVREEKFHARYEVNSLMELKKLYTF